MAESVTTPDGRLLEVFVDGPEDGTAVIRHHGTPSGGRHYRPYVAAAAERGLRLVGYSRPGYGGSDRHEGRAVADCAADVVAIADALGLERFYVEGGSGGGPHVLACAALLPDRVLAAASIAGVAPWGADGLDWVAGMGDENVEEFGAALTGGEELRAFLEPQRDQLRQANAEALLEVLGTLVSDVDRRALTGELVEFFVDETAHAVAPGIWGWFDDDIAFTTPWGFELDAIQVPVAVWHGAQDRFVPFAHGKWLADRVPSASAHLFEDEGHISIAVAKYGEILDDLVAAARDRVG